MIRKMDVLESGIAFENLKSNVPADVLLEVCFDCLSYDERSDFIERVAYDLEIEPEKLID